MQRITSGLVVTALFALGAGCGGAEGGKGSNIATTESVISAKEVEAEDDNCGPGNVDFGTGSEGIERQLNKARHAVCRYRLIEAALADGYANSGLPCIPGQGYHYIKSSLVGTTDIRHPSVLMYTADGRLNSPEWIAPVSQFPTPPSIFGQQMHIEDELGLWILHVWVWKLNPNGVFNDVNPDVTCP